MIAQLSCFLAVMVGIAGWMIGVHLMVHHCEDLATLGLRGKRLAGFSIGALLTVVGFAMMLFAGATGIYLASGQADAWFKALGVA